MRFKQSKLQNNVLSIMVDYWVNLAEYILCYAKKTMNTFARYGSSIIKPVRANIS